jgi:predicted Rdx family selenoprotein
MKHEITFYKDTGNEALRGKTVELFKISWHEGPGIWVRDEGGKYWGMYKLDTQEVRRLNVPERLGHIVSFEEEGVDHLEAEDLSITPEAGDLGEEN